MSLHASSYVSHLIHCCCNPSTNRRKQTPTCGKRPFPLERYQNAAPLLRPTLPCNTPRCSSQSCSHRRHPVRSNTASQNDRQPPSFLVVQVASDGLVEKRTRVDECTTNIGNLCCPQQVLWSVGITGTLTERLGRAKRHTHGEAEASNRHTHGEAEASNRHTHGEAEAQLHS